MATETRRASIDFVGDVAAWGAHFCLFYETKEDLLDTLISYCKSGLEKGEYCLWIVAEPLTIDEAGATLRTAVPDLDRYFASSHLEIVPGRDFFLPDGAFDGKRLTASCYEKVASVSARGYPGMRITGDTTWLSRKEWTHFCDYEDGLNQLIGNQRLAVLCTYPLATCGAPQILDVVRTHQFVLARRHGNWDVLETATLKRAKAELKGHNEELERRVVERSRELLEAEQRYRVTIETANDVVVSADESGVIQSANAATMRVFGYDPKELIGKPLTVLMPETMRNLHENGFERYLATGQRHINWQGTELTGLRKNGQEFPLEVSFAELTTDGRRIFTGFIRDITKRKQAEDTFRHIVAGTAPTTGSDFFQSLVQHLAQALRVRYAFVTTCDDQKHARTLAVCKNDGFGEDFEFDIADTPCEKVLHGEVCHYRQGLQGLFPRDKLLADWGAESYLAVPMLDRGNRVIGHIAILDNKPMDADLRTIDLLKIFASRGAAELKRQKAEDQLQASLQERERLRNVQAELAHINRVSTMGELTASLAHEIKQPISAAMTDAQTCIRWLACERPEVAEAREAASRLVKDVTRANEIIGRIGSLFKKHVPTRELIDVNEIIREMIGLMRSEATRHSISIRSELADGLPRIVADRVGLQQVLMNLMLNALEAMRDMPAPGTLTIVSRRSEDGELSVSILDTGVGVSSEQVEKIFSAFVTSKAQGTGMGLRISRSIIESHGGRLWATPNTGPGATFQFVLPVEQSARQTA